MVRESAVENAKSVYLQNPYWKKVYEEAPSDAAIAGISEARMESLNSAESRRILLSMIGSIF